MDLKNYNDDLEYSGNWLQSVEKSLLEKRRVLTDEKFNVLKELI